MSKLPKIKDFNHFKSTTNNGKLGDCSIFGHFVGFR